MSKNWHNILLMCVMTLLSASAWGQIQNNNINPIINSPLSRFGLGELAPQYYTASAGMAGLSAAWQDLYHLNTVNPASLASLQATAFEGGLYAKHTKLTVDGMKDDVWQGNLQYLSLGFPLRNTINRTLDRKSNEWNAGMSITLIPFSQVGYDVRLVDTSVPGIDVSTNTLKGAGGTNQLKWGTGFRYKQLSVGVDVGFMFGQIINSRLVELDSLTSSLSTEYKDDLSFRGTRLTVGAQYAIDFKDLDKDGVEVPNGKRVILGGYYSNGSDFTAEGTQFTRRYLLGVVSDTISYNTAIEGTGTLPSSYAFGVHYQQINRLNVGVEYGATTWTGYRNTLKPESLSDSYYLAVGGEFIPKYNSYNNYWERIRYRMGVRYTADALTLDGEQVKGVALTLGAGFPVILPRQQVSFINTAVEIGRSGVDNVFEETFVNLKFGFTLNDNSWFFKRKFN